MKILKSIIYKTKMLPNLYDSKVVKDLSGDAKDIYRYGENKSQNLKPIRKVQKF